MGSAAKSGCFKQEYQNKQEPKNKSLDDKIKEAEIKRIQAETSRIESEKTKLDLEKAWYRKKIFYKAVAFGVWSIPIFFYIKDIVIPLNQIEDIKRAWENQVKEDSLRKEVLALQKEKEEQTQKFILELTQLKQLNVASLKDNKKLSEESSLTKKQRDGYRQIVEMQELRISELNQQIKQKKSEIPVYVTIDQAQALIKERGYFDFGLNPNGPGVENQFVLKQNGKVIYDAATGLTWQQSGSSKVLTIEQAQKYIDDLNQEIFCGYNNWRLPSLEEVMSLLELKNDGGKKWGFKIYKRPSLFNFRITSLCETVSSSFLSAMVARSCISCINS